MRFFRLTAPAAMPVQLGAVSLKTPHRIVTLRFSEVVKDRAKYSSLKIAKKYLIIAVTFD